MFAYVTLHRPFNVDDKDNLVLIMDELTRLAENFPVVFPVHPRTRKMFIQYGIPLNGGPNLKLIDPIGYHDSLCLTERAKFVLTDSGRLQEESTYLHTPCLTLRPNTERPITIEVGTNKLTQPEQLAADIEKSSKNDASLGGYLSFWMVEPLKGFSTLYSKHSGQRLTARTFE